MSKDRPDSQPQSTALMRLDPQALLQSALEHNAGIETLERLVALSKDVRAQQAKEAWHVAIARFQETCPPISRSKKANISTRGGSSYSYTYAPLAEIMSTIQPVMGPLGLSVSFRMRFTDNHVIATCLVAHEMGHNESSGEVSMPFDKGDGTGANTAQRVGIAATYAKRYALLAILGIAPEEDVDARGTPERAPAVAMPTRSSERAQEPAQDEPGSNDGPPPKEAPAAGRLISEKQRGRLWAIAYKSGGSLGLEKEDVNDKVRAILKKRGIDSSEDVTSGMYDAVIKEIEEWGAGD